MEPVVVVPEASAIRVRFFALSRGCAPVAYCSFFQFPVVSNFSVTVCVRSSCETASFVHASAKAKSRDQPPMLQGRVRAAFSRRWEGILACTAAKSFAAHRNGSVLGARGVAGFPVRVKCRADVHSHLVISSVDILWMIFQVFFFFKKKGLDCF